MKLSPSAMTVLVIVLFSIGLVLLSVFFSLFGYVLTAACTVSLAALLASLWFARKDMVSVLSGLVDRYSAAALAAIVLLFVLSALFFLKGNELIFFDENIYQDIAMNMAAHGSALTCIYGTGLLQRCFEGTLGFDPAGLPFIMAIAFVLFGAGVSTAYGLELLLGAMSIVFVFLLAGVMTNRKDVGVAAALIFALIPELFIWSRTPANPSLPFMAFATLTLFLFILFTRKGTRATFSAFLFALAFTVYMRTEALFLVPIACIIFFTLGSGGIKDTAKKRLKALMGWLANERSWLPLIIAFVIIIEPEIYFMFLTAPQVTANAQFYLTPTTQTFSLSNFVGNAVPNIQFFAGLITEYPIIFLPELTLFAIIGAFWLLRNKKYARGRGVLLALLCMFFCYYLLYDFYFSGSVLSGTSVRFMLITYPALAILAALGVCGIGDLAAGYLRKNTAMLSGVGAEPAAYMAYAVLLLAFFLLPFAGAVPFLTSPNYLHSGYPVNYTANATGGAGPYSMIYPNRSLAFINDNYRLVPTSCLVITLAPYLWYGLNRSASVPQAANSSESLGNYTCFVFDYDYWCTIKPYNTTVCKEYITEYKVKRLATVDGYGDSNYSLYQLLNYTGT